MNPLIDIGLALGAALLIVQTAHLCFRNWRENAPPPEPPPAARRNEKN